MISETDLLENYNLEITLDTLEDNETMKNIIACELEGIIDDGFDILTKREVEVMKLKMKGYDTKVICERLKMSRESFWVTTFRAREKLKKYLNLNWAMIS